MLNETSFRLVPFLITLLVMASLEQLYPWRMATQNRVGRWRNHLALQVVAIILLRVSLSISLIGVAL